jgi:hypothetical protein
MLGFKHVTSAKPRLICSSGYSPKLTIFLYHKFFYHSPNLPFFVFIHQNVFAELTNSTTFCVAENVLFWRVSRQTLRSSKYFYMHTCMHAYIHAHICIHTSIHVHIYIRINLHMHMDIHVHIHIHMTRTHTYDFGANIFATTSRTLPHARARAHTHTHTGKYTHVNYAGMMLVPTSSQELDTSSLSHIYIHMCTHTLCWCQHPRGNLIQALSHTHKHTHTHTHYAGTNRVITHVHTHTHMNWVVTHVHTHIMQARIRCQHLCKTRKPCFELRATVTGNVLRHSKV